MIHKIFEPITKAFIDRSEKVFEKSKSTTEAIEEMIEPNFYVQTLEVYS